MRLILCLSAFLLSACATQPAQQTADRTSHPCPVFTRTMGDIETTLDARAGT